MSFDPNVANAQYHDVTLECMDCPNTFLFTAGEQKFYTEKGYEQPKRCPECRNKKKAQRLAKDKGDSVR